MVEMLQISYYFTHNITIILIYHDDELIGGVG